MSRQKPWRADNPDAVIVARPSRWGNPFKVGGRYVGRGPWSRTCPYPEIHRPVGAYLGHDGRTGQRYGTRVDKVRDRAHAVELFRAHIAYEDAGQWNPSRIRAELAGRDLACWCPLDSPCHGDVLLELANGAEQ